MENTFDYVVVGAGSSGCVMANRLCEDGTDTVLILEAGGKDTNMFIRMPSGYSQIVPTKNDNNYGFETEPEAFLRRVMRGPLVRFRFGTD